MTFDKNLLQVIGKRVRARRQQLGLSQQELASRANVSRRFLIQLEAGDGNATVLRLADICAALLLSFDNLFRGLGPAPKTSIALVGLRGGGKSTIGRALAARLKLEFVELDEQVEHHANMSLAEIFEFRDPSFYREAEAYVLEQVFTTPSRQVVAVGGSLVTSPSAWRRLRELSVTVWLRASPESHFERVTAQGDLRPMVGRPNALDEVRMILLEREPLYAMAHLAVDTDAHGIGSLVELIANHIESVTSPDESR